MRKRCTCDGDTVLTVGRLVRPPPHRSGAGWLGLLSIWTAPVSVIPTQPLPRPARKTSSSSWEISPHFKVFPTEEPRSLAFGNSLLGLRFGRYTEHLPHHFLYRGS